MQIKGRSYFKYMGLGLLVFSLVGCNITSPTKEVPAPIPTSTKETPATIPTSAKEAATMIPTSTHEAETHYFSQEDNQTRQTIYVGDSVQVVLEGNPTTGFTWELSQNDEDLLALQGEPEYQAKQDIPGSSGVFTFTFLSQKSGTVELEFIYHRPFEEGIAPLSEYMLTLDIQAN